MPLFQFHKGTIRTFVSSSLIEYVTYFNSIKVRLELRLHQEKGLEWVHFNSIKVRLELSSSTPVRADEVFQFHKGTIRTGTWTERWFTFFNFNSIKVRLEQPLLAWGLRCVQFQFHKGTIRTFPRKILIF